MSAREFFMTDSYLDHPSEEVLERFLLHNAQEDELDRVETHILACEGCVSRLEQLELQIAAAKIALQELSRQPRPERAIERRSVKEWFTLRTLSWAGAAAVFALAIGLTPRFMLQTNPPTDVTLSANRGSETPLVPQGRPLHLHLTAPDVANGPVRVSVVDAYGSEVWTGAAKAQDERVELSLPKIEKAGSHFLRLYALRADKTSGDLLREFPFQVR